jgi:hypothetical protein
MRDPGSVQTKLLKMLMVSFKLLSGYLQIADILCIFSIVRISPNRRFPENRQKIQVFRTFECK